jgi:NitT/TauT family transport system substrate-binding protein
MPLPHAPMKPNLPRRMAVALAAAVALTIAAGCSAAPTTGQDALTDPNIVVAAVPATGATGLYIAVDQGIFSRAGLHVTIESPASAADTVSQLLTGHVEVTLGQWTTAIALQAKGMPLRALASGNSGGPGLESILTGAGSPITTLSQLKGKKVAVNALGGLSQDMTENVLAPSGISGSQIQWKVVPFPKMGAAVASGQVAAAFMVEPYTSEAEETFGLAELADPNQGGTQNLPITGYFTTRKWFDTHQATARAFVAALEQGEQIAANDRGEAERALIRHLGINPATAAVMSLGTFPLGVDTVQLARVGHLMQTHGQLVGNADVASIVAALTK